MAKNYKGAGCTMTFVAAAVVLSGAALMVGDTAVVAKTDAASGETCVGEAEGVFNLPKAAGAISQGAKVYLSSDGQISTTASGNKLAGKCWAAAANGDNSVDVKLNS